jgi:hypothetical protein
MAVMHSKAACFTSFLMSQVRSATGLTRFTSRYPRKHSREAVLNKGWDGVGKMEVQLKNDEILSLDELR